MSDNNNDTNKTFVVERLQCSACSGVGLINNGTPKVCEHCDGKRCYRCDRNGPYKLYIECNICNGSGSVYFNRKISEPVLIYKNNKWEIIDD